MTIKRGSLSLLLLVACRPPEPPEPPTPHEAAFGLAINACEWGDVFEARVLSRAFIEPVRIVGHDDEPAHFPFETYERLGLSDRYER